MTTTRYTLCALALTLAAACDSRPEPATPSVPLLAPATAVFENAMMPTTALNPHTGALYLAFFRKEGDLTHVYLSRREAGSETWSEAVRVDSGPGDASAHGQAPAQVVIGPESNVYVVWTNVIPIEGRRFPASNLLIARSTDGGRTFSEEREINSDAASRSSSHTFHDIAVGRDGAIYVSWLDSRKRDASTQAAETPVRVASLGGHGHDARAHLPGTEVWVAVSRDAGATFSEGTVVAEETCQCCRTSLVVAADGTVYLAWRHIFPGMERDMAIARSTDGGRTFSAPSRIHADAWSVEACPHSGPSLAIDAAGTLHIGWYTGEESRAGLYYARSADGTTFSAPQALVQGVGVSQIKLSGNGSAKVLVAWEDKHDQTVRIGETGTNGVVSIDTLHAGSSLPALTTGPGGWVVAAQSHSDATLRIGR